MKRFKPRVLAFLWSYFRGYAGWMGISLIATTVFAVSTVLLLALFRPILSEVLLADEDGAARRDAAPLFSIGVTTQQPIVLRIQAAEPRRRGGRGRGRRRSVPRDASGRAPGG